MPDIKILTNINGVRAIQPDSRLKWRLQIERVPLIGSINAFPFVKKGGGNGE